MKTAIIIAALAAHAHAAIDWNKLINGISSFPIAQDVDDSLNFRRDLTARQASTSAGSGANQAYLDSVCSPNITNPNPVPPCISINTIQTLCQPNGTSSLAYQASAQCLCNTPSSFFADWLGCRKCLVFHGGLSDRDYNYNSALLGAASSSLCSGTPTTDFAAIFASVTLASGTSISGATTSSDAAPSSTAVSLYYTVSGKQGPGSITGSATGATGTGLVPTGSNSGTSRASGSSTSRAASGSSGSGNIAVATAAPVVPALMALGGIAAALI